MLPDRVSNPGPLTYESGALPIALRGPAVLVKAHYFFTDSLIGPGHLHRKKHTEPSFCVLSIPPSINQSINLSDRPPCLSVRTWV